MTKRATFTDAQVSKAERLALAGLRVTLQRGDVTMIVEPPSSVPASRPESDVDRWMRENGYDQG